MAKNVIILGAGASKEYGAPVMGKFFDVARDLYASGRTGSRRASFERVFDAISCLQAVHSKSDFDLVNLESIFTSFEMAKILDKFPRLSDPNFDQLIDDLKWVIVETLQRTAKIPITDREKVGPKEIVSFIDAIESIPKINRGGNRYIDTAIITFNYDLLFDVAITRSRESVGIDYGIAKQQGPQHFIPLLKLHGSLNWTRETQSGEIRPWFLDNYFGKKTWDDNQENFELTIAEELSKCPSDREVDGKPVIVPPSWNKADHHSGIAEVWKQAAVELGEAESVFVVGYSLPETDSFFRQLFALGSESAKILRKFWVYNPDPSRKEVFSSMLGPGAKHRFKFHDDKFKTALQKIRNEIAQ